ncbi:hypothetical protein J0H58_05315 [bacterium]|nr:hypothetical protein [bacterium]
MDREDLELAAEVVCAIARAVVATGGDPEKLKSVPLGSTISRLVANHGESPPSATDHLDLIEFASAVLRAREGDEEVFRELHDRERQMRERFKPRR